MWRWVYGYQLPSQTKTKIDVKTRANIICKRAKELREEIIENETETMNSESVWMKKKKKN